MPSHGVFCMRKRADFALMGHAAAQTCSSSLAVSTCPICFLYMTQAYTCPYGCCRHGHTLIRSTEHGQMRRRAGHALRTAAQTLSSAPSRKPFLHQVRDTGSEPCFIFPDTLALSASRIAPRWSALSSPPRILSPRFAPRSGGPRRSARHG